MLQVRPQATSQDVFGHQVWKVFKEHLSIIDSELWSKDNRVSQSLLNYMLHQRPLFPLKKSSVFASHPNHLNDSKHHRLLLHLLLTFSRLLRWLHLSRGKSGTARAFGTNWVRTGTQNIWVRWVVAAGQRSHLLLWPESPQWSSGFDQTKLSELGKFLMTWQTRDLSLPNFEATTRIPGRVPS